MNKYYKLFANCFPVKGASRSVIYDLGRHTYHVIPNELYDILQKQKNKKITKVINYYGNKNRKVIEDYFSFLFKKEIIFSCNRKDIKRFPNLSLKYNSPHIISNVILQVRHDSLLDYDNIFEQIDLLGNIDLQLQVVDLISLDQLSVILESTMSKRIGYVEVLLPEIIDLKPSQLYSFLSLNYRVSKMVFYNCHIIDNKYECDIWRNDLAVVSFTDKNVLIKEECGKIDSSGFIVNMDFFMETKSYNNCLNRKLCIDIMGNIKNCIHMDKIYGNVLKDKISDVVLSNSFQNLWHITKDDVDICRDCEYRYMCSDCRANTVEGNVYSKPLYCKYSPYHEQ